MYKICKYTHAYKITGIGNIKHFIQNILTRLQ